MEKNKSIEDTEAWNVADWDYAGLISQDMMPFFGKPLAGQERIDYLNEIIEGCPEYYPALLEMGYRYIQIGEDKIGKEYIDQGLSSLKTHFSKKEVKEAYYHTCEFLEEHLRFELAIKYYHQIMDIERDKANVYDLMSYCYVYMGDYEKARESQKNALKLCDTNNRYFCNMGWIEMICGNLDAAKKMLDKSLRLDKNDEVTINNYAGLKIMLKDKKLKNWEDYLLRQVDFKYLDKLEEKEDFEEYEKQVKTYNLHKIEAFKIDLLRNPKLTLEEKFDMLFSLRYVFDLIWESYESDYFFNDDIVEVEISFKSIMHKVILKTGDIDEEIFNGIYDAILAFYKFLAKRKVISEYKSLEKKMVGLKKSLIEKMETYNEVRHDSSYTDEEKEDIREELFGIDAYWPF